MKVSQRISTKASAHRGVYRASIDRSDKAYATSVSPVQSPRKNVPESPKPQNRPPKDNFAPKLNANDLVNKKPFAGPKQTTRIGTFNVNSSLTEDRLPLLTNSLKLNKLSFLGLTETNKIESGSMISHPYGAAAPSATLYWSGHENDKKKKTGVALLVSQRANRSLIDWSPISDRILKARFETRHLRLTVFVVYAPHGGRKKKVQDAFWTQLSDEIRAAPTHDMLLVIGDMNANTGTSREAVSDILGPWTNPAERNSPGDHMIDLCQTHRLCITNTFFRHKAIHRDTFRAKVVKGKLIPPKLIDYVLVNQRFRSSILDTRVYRDLTEMVDSDHEAVFSKIRVKLRSGPHIRRPPRLDSKALSRDDKVRIQYRDALYAELLNAQDAPERKDSDDEDDPGPSTVESLWEELKMAIRKASRASLPEIERRARIPWMTEEAIDLILVKAKAFRAYREALTEGHLTEEERVLKVNELFAVYKEARNKSKIACRKAREDFWKEEAKDTEDDLRKRHYATVFRRFRMFTRGKNRAPSDRLRDADGRLLTTKADKLKRWRNYFQELLYVDDFDLEVDVNAPPPGREELKTPEDEPPPSLAEVQAGIARLKNCKAPGADGITSEMVKSVVHSSRRNSMR